MDSVAARESGGPREAEDDSEPAESPGAPAPPGPPVSTGAPALALDGLSDGFSEGPSPALGRREALGLSLFGALGVSMAGSWLIHGDAGQGAATTPATTPAAGPAAGREQRRPGRGRPEPVRVTEAHRPLTKVHDLIPTAPARAIALTIDDGPNPRWTPKVLDLLAQHEVTATFCLIGMQVRAYPDLVREIVDAGHQVANHTMRHPVDFGRLPVRRLEAEIGEAHVQLIDMTGLTPKLFRAPGGSWSKRVLGCAARYGMLPLDWDVDPRDWSCPGTEQITRTLLRAAPGDILLCHDGGGDRSETLRALRTVIPRLKGRGLEFITL